MSKQLVFDIDNPQLALAAWSRIAEPGDQVAACLVKSVGPVAALRWLADADNSQITAAIQSDQSQLGFDGLSQPIAAALARWQPRLENLDPRRELRVLRDLGGVLLGPDSPDWPARLADLGDREPLALWVVGQAAQSPSLASLTSKCVAVVGSRAATHYGEVVTGSITEHLVAAGLTVLSGGAFGIDAAAHRAAVSLDGQSVAVMAGGVDRFYPVANTTLLEQVAASGAVIAEVPPGSAPRRERFLLRNRLIAALAGASIVVEAGWRSGAQSTARLAAELLRPVGAVPGPITSAASAGCHRLIREGVATCVTDGAEVVELLQPCDASDAEMMHDDGLPGLLDDLPPDQARLLDCLPKHGSARLTALVRAAGVPERSVLVALGGLEGRGLVHREVGAWRRACQTKAA